jgi:hypothetical protein
VIEITTMAEMFVSAAISTVTAKTSDFLLKDFTTALGLGVEQSPETVQLFVDQAICH